MITLLNTSIVTTYGAYGYRPVTLDEARALIRCSVCDHASGQVDGESCRACRGTGFDYQSAIGHESTAQILSDLLGVTVPVNRITYLQGEGEVALVFKLKGRAPEGVILDRAQIEAIGYEFGLLTRIRLTETPTVTYAGAGTLQAVGYETTHWAYAYNSIRFDTLRNGEVIASESYGD